MTTRDEIAAKINGNDYLSEVTALLEAEAKAAGVVIVFGASDDLMEFRGAIRDEIDACGGVVAYVTTTDLLLNDCDNGQCPHFDRLKAKARTIRARWDKDGYSWVYETDIPHATFEIFEFGDKYCRGIVFNLADVGQPT